jgi:L-fucose mutarotase/ribose pyranase (RbsD/FucU family)
MISDIVLLKELPDFIQNSIEAYIGCVSGAMLRDEYLEVIRAAGFQDVEILSETHFPVELMANDPIITETIKKLEIPPEKVEELASWVISVQSIKVHAVKPTGTA